MNPTLHFYCNKISIFLTTYPPINTNIICESSPEQCHFWMVNQWINTMKSTFCHFSLKVYIDYSRVHKSSDSFFSKILEKPSIVQKKMIPHLKGLDFSQRWSKKKFKMADLENLKWPPQKNLIFQLRQFSIFFHENFMDWSLG